MNLKNFVKIFSHFLIWCIVLVAPVYFMARSGNFDMRPYLFYLVKVGMIAVIFYVNYLYLIDKLLFNKKFITYALVNIVLVGGLVGIQDLVVTNIMEPHRMEREQPENRPVPDHLHPDRPKYDHQRPRPPQFMRILSDYLLIVFAIGLSVAIKMTVRWYRDSINLEKVKSMQLEADLRNLRSQLNPHFLFNTLNNIYSLIAIDKSKAQDSVHRLSSLLRYVLYEDDRQFVPIDKELEFTRNYIDLMALRVGGNVKLNVTIDDKGSRDLIASLMFMTLIENAFKHGINNADESLIDITILVEKGKGVLCTVENSLPVNDTVINDKNSGIGLANLTKRLELLYPNKHEFNVTKRDNKFIALLRIDFDQNKDMI